jgi:hypothetical protein
MLSEALGKEQWAAITERNKETKKASFTHLAVISSPLNALDDL